MLIPMGDVMDMWSPTDPPRVLHCGAHLGEERDAYDQTEAEWVVWVEGNPALLPRLSAHLTEFRPYTRTVHMIYPAVLGPEEGVPVTFHVAAETMNSSLLAPGSIPVDYVDEMTAQARTVDSVCSEVGQPTMLNLDLQGADLMVLSGARSALPGVEAVYCEVAEVAIYEGAPHWSEVDRFLRGEGFRLAHVEMSRNGEGFGDGLWLRVGVG